MPPPRASHASRLLERFRLAQALHQAGRLAEARSIYQELLRQNPRHADALHFLGLVALQTNQSEHGVRLIERALAINPKYPEALGNLGLGYADMGRHQDALASFDKALALKPHLADLHDNRGTVLRDLRQYEAAVASHDRAIVLRPDDAGAHSNRGNALRDLGRYDDALASYDRALVLQPDFLEPGCNRASMLQTMQRYEDALAGFDAAIARAPNHADAHRGRGNVLRDMRRPEVALVSFSAAVDLAGDSAVAHNDRGNALFDLRRYDEALAGFARAIALRPDYAEAHNNHGNALRELQRFEEALASYAKAIALRPDYAQAFYHRANTLVATQRMVPALADYDRAIALSPDYADAHRARGVTLATLRRYKESLIGLEQAKRLAPDTDWLPGDILFVKRQICDWTADEADVAAVEKAVRLGRRVASPFTIALISASPVVQKQIAEIFARALCPPVNQMGAPPSYAGRAKIHIAYISADFREHPMMHLMAGLLEHHDKSRFELTALSLSPATGDDCHKRVRKTFDRFIDVHLMPDREVAALARRLHVDIAVDLMGFTTGFRTGIFSYRAAAVQVQYLGFPATMGAGYIDYIIADPVVIPPEAAGYYSENVVYLPDSYQANDRHRPTAASVPTRIEQGLPVDGFVFCCFNNNCKITPEMFDRWMRILRCVEGSVLWLFEDNQDAGANLQVAAEAKGVAPQRLVFAKRVPLADHMARHRLADLFLDTRPYNAHTTASDALWAGLPVLTQIGDTFAGRVAASLLHAISVPELVTTTPEEYEALAVGLATHPERLQSIRSKLDANRLITPLFDTARFTRHLEAAYRAMHGRAVAGLEPTAIHIPSDAEALRDPITIRR
jgi:protein O-GlcNAc transferase